MKVGVMEFGLYYGFDRPISDAQAAGPVESRSGARETILAGPFISHSQPHSVGADAAENDAKVSTGADGRGVPSPSDLGV